MKGPWGPVGARALARAAPPTPSCTDGVNKDFSRQEKRHRMENHNYKKLIHGWGGGPGEALNSHIHSFHCLNPQLGVACMSWLAGALW